MPLSWNEIKSKVFSFVKEWEHKSNEDAEVKSFCDDFFRVFDVLSRRLASFEYHVKKLNNKNGFVDLFWPGTVIVEHIIETKRIEYLFELYDKYTTGLFATSKKKNNKLSKRKQQ